MRERSFGLRSPKSPSPTWPRRTRRSETTNKELPRFINPFSLLLLCPVRLDKYKMIKATGQALAIGSPRRPNTFNLEVGEGIDVTKICCSVVGEKPGEVWTQNRGEGLIEVSYRIGLVGKYEIRITYEGKHIEGSPYTLTVR